MSSLPELLSADLTTAVKQAAGRRGCSPETFVRQCVRSGLNGEGDPLPSDSPADHSPAPHEAEASIFRTLAEHSPVGIYCFRDPDEPFVYVNPRLSEILGYTVDELQGQIAAIDIIHPKDRPGVREQIQRRLTGEVVRARQEPRIVTRDEKIRHACAFGSRIDYQGRPAIIGTLLDITERVEQNEALVAAKEEAERMHRLKASFLANMSHEIRTPITAILGYTELLATGEVAPNEEVTGIIQASGERLLETVDNVLYLAQLESESLELRPDRIDLSAEVPRIADPLARKAQSKGLFFNIEAAMDDPIAFQDPAVLERLLKALIDNAVKFTATGGVTVRARGEGSTIILEVEDTGIGLAAGGEQIFEAFRQESAGLQRAYEGSGLGLTIAKKLAERAGGTLALTSEEDAGAVATARLPRRAGSPGEEGGSLYTARPWGLGHLPADQAVLVVEDDPATRALIPELLPETYAVETAMTADEALARAQSSTFDLVFMDINLKDRIDGVALKNRMQELEGYETAIFVAVTAYAMPGDGERFHDEGFDGYVPKPFTRERFYENLLQIW